MSSRAGGGSGSVGKASSPRRSRDGDARDNGGSGGRSKPRGSESESFRRREERSKERRKSRSREQRSSGSLAHSPDEALPRGGGGEGIAAASSSRRRRADAVDGGDAGGGLTAVAEANSASGSPLDGKRGQGRVASPGSSYGGSNDGSIMVPTITASSHVARPSTRLSDVLAGKVNSGKMRRGSSGKSQGDVPLLDLRRSASTKGSSGELGSGGESSPDGRDAAARTEKTTVVAAGDRARRTSSGGGGSGSRTEDGVLTKAYIRKPEGEERRRRERRRGSGGISNSRRDRNRDRDPNSCRGSSSRRDRDKRREEKDEREDDPLRGTPFSSAEAGGDGAAAAAAMEAVTRAAQNFNSMYSSESEASDAARSRDTPQRFPGPRQPPEQGGDDDGVAPRSISASGGAQTAAPLANTGRSAEDAESASTGPTTGTRTETASTAPQALSATSFSNAAKESRAAQRTSTNKPSSRGVAPDGSAVAATAPRGRARVRQVRRSGSGDGSSSGSDGESGSGSGGSVSFEDDDGPTTDGGAGAARGRRQYRQSSRNRMRELAYQAARSRSRGSCRSLSSLQRVEEVSEESLSSVSPRPTTATALSGEESAVARARLEQESRGLSFDKDSLDYDSVSSPFHALTSAALHQQQQQRAEEKCGGSAAPPSTAGGGGVDVDDEAALSSASAVSPSSAPRYAVSGIKVSGNAAGVCVCVCVCVCVNMTFEFFACHLGASLASFQVKQAVSFSAVTEINCMFSQICVPRSRGVCSLNCEGVGHAWIEHLHGKHVKVAYKVLCRYEHVLEFNGLEPYRRSRFLSPTPAPRPPPVRPSAQLLRRTSAGE